MSSAPRSSSLFHFTKSEDVLKSILKNGFWPRYCLEDIQWQGHVDFEFVAFPMVCFCDIPIGRIAEHVRFYGSFGLGLTKEWGIEKNLNPIMYIASKNNLVQNAITSLTNVIHSHPIVNDRALGLAQERHIFAHAKPIKGKMIINGESEEKEFYQESEWRFVPQHQFVADHLTRLQFNSPTMLDAMNLNTYEYCRLKWTPNDIRYIFVPTDADIPSIMDFIQTQLADFTYTEIKVLMSRVTSLESLKHDL